MVGRKDQNNYTGEERQSEEAAKNFAAKFRQNGSSEIKNFFR
jgi:hypothetical protein